MFVPFYSTVFLAFESGNVIGLRMMKMMSGGRDSHEEALNELLLAAQGIGYTFVEVEIAKIADRALEMAFGGGVSGLGIGSRTETAEGAVLGTLAGWCIGLLVGANMKKVEVMFRVQRTSAGWRLVEVAPQGKPTRSVLQAG